jgi:hypothetical protein
VIDLLGNDRVVGSVAQHLMGTQDAGRIGLHRMVGVDHRVHLQLDVYTLVVAFRHTDVVVVRRVACAEHAPRVVAVHKDHNAMASVHPPRYYHAAPNAFLVLQSPRSPQPLMEG